MTLWRTTDVTLSQSVTEAHVVTEHKEYATDARQNRREAEAHTKRTFLAQNRVKDARQLA